MEQGSFYICARFIYMPFICSFMPRLGCIFTHLNIDWNSCFPYKLHWKKCPSLSWQLFCIKCICISMSARWKHASYWEVGQFNWLSIWIIYPMPVVVLAPVKPSCDYWHATIPNWSCPVISVLLWGKCLLNWLHPEVFWGPLWSLKCLWKAFERFFQKNQMYLSKVWRGLRNLSETQRCTCSLSNPPKAWS